jgi:hypothetical protein
MNKAQELIETFKLSPNSYYPEDVNPYDFRTGKSTDMDNTLEEQERLYKEAKEKWKDFIYPKCYGWGGLGNPTPSIWYTVLDQFLEYVKEIDPDFKILQIKIKFGGLRLYLDSKNEQIQEMCRELEEVMTDKKLIY